jgi:predicted metal-dependent peptidase
MAEVALTQQQKLTVRRIAMGLTKEFPFFGHVFACCRFVFDDAVPTAGLKIGEFMTVQLGSKFFEKKDFNDQRFILLHELSHWMFQHPIRAVQTGTKNSKNMSDQKNMAMDLAVNSFLKRHSPFRLPQDAKTPDDFKLDWDRTYEWYLYQLMKSQQKQQGGGGQGSGQCDGRQQGQGGGKGNPSGDDQGKGQGQGKDDRHGAGGQHHWECSVSEAEAGELACRMYQAAKMAGQDPGGALGEIYKVRAEIDWRTEFLRAAQKAELSEEWTFTKRRMSKRFDTIPGLIHDYLGELYLIVDTSGSMGPKEIGACFDIVDKLFNMGYIIHIFEVDAKLQQEYLYEGVPPKVKGGGGTAFQSAFKHIIETYRQCEQIICLTDGYICDLDRGKPPVDMVFIISPDGTTDLPYGEVIKMKLLEESL